MNWNERTCEGCGLINDYTITEKSGHSVCTCNGCGKFLGNKPKDYDYKSVRIYFGKYKDALVSEIDDLSYLTWLHKNAKLSGNILRAVSFKIGVK